MSDLDLAVVGNCSFGALIDRRGRVVWCCLPRFDGDPVFCDLLNNEGDGDIGFWDIELEGLAHAEQRYWRNSAVVETRLTDGDGNAIEIIDFAPRFKQYDRTFRPTTLVRRIRPTSGAPRVRIRLRPTHTYGSGRPEITRGSNHIRYVLPETTLRLTTDAPPTYVLEELPFILEHSFTLHLGPDESLTAPVGATGREFLERTDSYWREWCRYLSLPFEWQTAVIRAAITLKLCSFEETGAVIAALTTSIPEAPHSGRNWDYRFCWLRDSYFVVHALNRLGVTRTMEGYLGYITNIVAATDGETLQPVFGISLETRLNEREEPGLAGYRGMGPVRVGNSAYQQAQNDGYGAVVLACAQSFFDERLTRPGGEALFHRLEPLGTHAVALWDQPDAGLWELRTRQQVHTFSSVMCWVACDRLARIAKRLGLEQREAHWRRAAKRMHGEIVKRAWNESLGSFVNAFNGEHVDASLLLLPELGFCPATDPRFQGTLHCIEQHLRRGDSLFRYDVSDDFGEPQTAFNVCTFWYVEALAAVGRVEEARELFQHMLEARNHLGLLSEDLDPASGELWGNFPQTYSMVGLINAAMRLSRSWEEAF